MGGTEIAVLALSLSWILWLSKSHFPSLPFEDVITPGCEQHTVWAGTDKLRSRRAHAGVEGGRLVNGDGDQVLSIVRAETGGGGVRQGFWKMDVLAVTLDLGADMKSEQE